MADEAEEVTKGVLEGVIDALTDKHSQLDLKLNGLTLSLGQGRWVLKISGSITMAAHMRDLTDAEKDAHVSANLARIRT